MDNQNKPTKDIFCAGEQAITPHAGYVDGNGDLVFVCNTCERFVKFPATVTKESLDGLLAVHEEANKGQVSVEAQEKLLNEVLGAEPATEVLSEETANGSDVSTETPLDTPPSETPAPVVEET